MKIRGYEQVEGWGYDAISVSSRSGDGMASLKACMADRVSVLAGPSGAHHCSDLLSGVPHCGIKLMQ